MQLSFIDKLYEKDLKGVNFIKNIDTMIKNMKYLRYKVEDRLNIMRDQESKEFNHLCYINNKLGYCMYWLATIGYMHEKEIEKDKVITPSDWYTRTQSQPLYGASEVFSTSKIYESTLRAKSLLNEFILRHKDRLEDRRLSRITTKFLKESYTDLVDEFKRLKFD